MCSVALGSSAASCSATATGCRSSPWRADDEHRRRDLGQRRRGRRRRSARAGWRGPGARPVAHQHAPCAGAGTTTWTDCCAATAGSPATARRRPRRRRRRRSPSSSAVSRSRAATGRGLSSTAGRNSTTRSNRFGCSASSRQQRARAEADPERARGAGQIGDRAQIAGEIGVGPAAGRRGRPAVAAELEEHAPAGDGAAERAGLGDAVAEAVREHRDRVTQTGDEASSSTPCGVCSSDVSGCGRDGRPE